MKASDVMTRTVITVDEPAMSITIGVNTSPLASKDGDKLTARQIKGRLDQELVGNVSLRVRDTELAERLNSDEQGLRKALDGLVQRIIKLMGLFRQNYPADWAEDDRVDDAIGKLNAAAARGCQTIVDPTVLGLGRDINRIVSDRNANIRSQLLATDSAIGYLIMDLDQDVSNDVKNGIADLETSIKTRILY